MRITALDTVDGQATEHPPDMEVGDAAVPRAAEVGHRWRNPVWRHQDGSFAEW